jgi:Fic family protein
MLTVFVDKSVNMSIIKGMLTKKQRIIKELKAEFDTLKVGKERLLDILYEAELPESVFNSNAIENSTLNIPETEQILMEMEVARDVSVREVFEAKNLARVSEYLRKRVDTLDFDTDLLLFLHQMLLSAIDDNIAGRFRGPGEYVRVGTHIAPPPEQIQPRLAAAFADFKQNATGDIMADIARFHLEFEMVHPFNDGNGRIGRVVMNFQLMQAGYPPIIIRDREKSHYYKSFKTYKQGEKIKEMNRVIYLALTESFHKRIAYLKGQQIVNLTDYARSEGVSKNTLLNKAKRQTIPAFRERGVWKMGVDV